MAVIVSAPGDVLDALCFAHYGREDAVVQVLEANPGLAGFGPVLPARLSIVMPADPVQTQLPVLRLWGNDA